MHLPKRSEPIFEPLPTLGHPWRSRPRCCRSRLRRKPGSRATRKRLNGTWLLLTVSHGSQRTRRWSGMDSNFRFRARMATVPSLQAMSISLKLFGSCRTTCRPQGPKFCIHFPPAAGRANYDRVIAALNDATWGLVPILVT